MLSDGTGLCSSINLYLPHELFRDLYENTTVATSIHVKDPGHSAKDAGDRLQWNTHNIV